MGWLAFQSPMWHSMSGDSFRYNAGLEFGANVLNLVSVFTLLLYFIMLAAVAIGIIAYLGLRFYRTMYTSEGYLTHTLPVTEGRLLFAKTFISGIWTLIISLATIVSVFFLLVFMVGALLPAGYTMADFWEEFQEFYRQYFSVMLSEMEAELGMNFSLYLIYLIISLVLGSFAGIMTLFGAISMGQLFAKHRVLMAIVSYIGISMVRGIFTSVVQAVITGIYVSGQGDSPAILGSYINTNSIVSLVITLLFGGVLYLVSWLVNTRKLNLE